MMDQTVNLTTQIFFNAFSDCQALSVVDNSVNYACFIKNAFLAKKINLSIGEKQL